MKTRNNMLILTLSFLLLPSPTYAEVWVNFDDLSATSQGQVPGSSADWIYTSATTNPNNAYYMTSFNTSGWRNTTPYQNNTKVFDYLYLWASTYNSPKFAFDTYGYLEIDDSTAVKGNSLRYTVTGGKNSITCAGQTETNCVGDNGLPLHSKEEYLAYLAAAQNPIEGGLKVGAPYLYFSNTSSDPYVPFSKAQGNNRLSIYVKLPADTVSVGPGGKDNPPLQTIHVGPFSYITKDLLFPNGDPNVEQQGHWYHWYYTQGGGWTHLVIDAHPQHTNTGLFPYPSQSYRDIGAVYFTKMHRFYITPLPYEGIGIAPYSVWFDEIEFINDSEPQNNETICSPSVMMLPSGIFEIGFNDKYKNNADSYSTYEVRYSFNQITNISWNSATPVHIQADSRFGNVANTDGKFKKWWPYYSALWVSFKVAPADEPKLAIKGKKIYFAIKDVSQQLDVDGNPIQNPVGDKAGRNYASNAADYDWDGDKAALKLIKRIDYIIAEPVPVLPAPAIRSISIQ